MVETAAAARPIPPLSPWYGRVGLGAVASFVGIGLGVELSARPVQSILGAALALAAAAVLFLARTRWALACAVLACAGTALVATGEPSNLCWFAVCVVGGWCALVAGTSAGVAFLVASALMFGGEWLFAVHDPGWATWTAGTTFTVLAAVLVRHQIVLVEQMRRLQADLAQRERADERTRIARELHDVIAHGLTVSLLHVSSARLAVEHDPSDAARSLADAERLTRQSLDDVRATVGMLRSPDDDERVERPAPGIADLQQLVDDLRAAQADVLLSLAGDLTDIPAPTGTTVYRIVQEALTNASRHAPGRAVQVQVAVDDDRVDLTVESGGAPGHGTGMGLLNMEERAQAVGGTCVSGPGGRGWIVHASLPRSATTGRRSA
jgi:signal transduction histidine kinase